MGTQQIFSGLQAKSNTKTSLIKNKQFSVPQPTESQNKLNYLHNKQTEIHKLNFIYKTHTQTPLYSDVEELSGNNRTLQNNGANISAAIMATF